MKITEMYNPIRRSERFIELEKLENWLRENGIEYRRYDRPGTEICNYLDMRHQIIIFDFDDVEKEWPMPVWSAICQKYSYGYEQRLIELGNYKTKNVYGYMKAEDVIEIFKKWRNEKE